MRGTKRGRNCSLGEAIVFGASRCVSLRELDGATEDEEELLGRLEKLRGGIAGASVDGIKGSSRISFVIGFLSVPPTVKEDGEMVWECEREPGPLEEEEEEEVELADVVENNLGNFFAFLSDCIVCLCPTAARARRGVEAQGAARPRGNDGTTVRFGGRGKNESGKVPPLFPFLLLARCCFRRLARGAFLSVSRRAGCLWGGKTEAGEGDVWRLSSSATQMK